MILQNPTLQNLRCVSISSSKWIFSEVINCKITVYQRKIARVFSFRLRIIKIHFERVGKFVWEMQYFSKNERQKLLGHFAETCIH